MREWILIKTAPKDGTIILAHKDGWDHPFLCQWRKNSRTKTFFWNDVDEEDCYDNEFEPPTHWIPIPKLQVMRNYSILKWVESFDGKSKIGVSHWEKCFESDNLIDAQNKMDLLAISGIQATLYEDGVNISKNYSYCSGNNRIR